MITSVQSLAGIIVAEATARSEARVRKLMTSVGLRFEHDAPFRTGRARGSVVPFVGAAPGTEAAPPPKQAFYPLHGAPDFDAAYEAWHLGTPAGVVMTVAYARRLSHGWSAQAPDGWVDALLADEISKAREATG